MINLATETILTLEQAARRLPPSREGRQTHKSSVYRWISSGIKTPHGVVRLEGVRVGGIWRTSAEAIERFIAASTPDFAATDPTPAPSTPGPRQGRRRRSKHSPV